MKWKTSSATSHETESYFFLNSKNTTQNTLSTILGRILCTEDNNVLMICVLLKDSADHAQSTRKKQFVKDTAREAFFASQEKLRFSD